MSKLTASLAALAVAAAAFGIGRATAPPPKTIDYNHRMPARFGAPTGPLGEALRVPDPIERASALLDAISTLGPEYAPEVNGALNQRGFRRGSIDTLLLAHYWALHEPEAATLWAIQVSPTSIRFPAIEITMEQWAKVDPEAAAEFLESSTVMSGKATRFALWALVRGWFRSGYPGLPEFIRSMDPGIARQRALSVYANQLMLQGGVEAATSWAEGLPDEDPLDRKFKLAALRRVMTEVAARDMDDALAWCRAQCDGPFGDNLRARLVKVWAAYDPIASFEYLKDEPPGTETDDAVVAAFETWMLYDATALAHYMAQWTKKGPSGIEPWIRPVAEPYALWISWDYPEQAMLWASLITDEQKRRATQITVARRWLKGDEAAAEAWLAQSPLSEEERERARTFPPGWKRRTSPVPEA